MTERNIRAEAGLSDDKPTILLCTDSATLPTGLARVVRSIFTPIAEKGEFQILQHGWYHLSAGSLPVAWKIIPVKRHPKNPQAFDPVDKMGEQSFTTLVESVKPDIVFTVTDYDRLKHIAESRARSSYSWVTYLPLDTFPPTRQWQDMSRLPDKTVYYTKFAQNWGAAVESPGEYIPHGVDTSLFQPLDASTRQFMREKFFKVGDRHFVITMSGRNLARKRLDLGIQAVSHLIYGAYSRCGSCKRITTHDYELPMRTFASHVPDTCPKCGAIDQMKPGINHDYLRLNIHSDLKENPRIPLYEIAEFWKVTNHVFLNASLQMSLGHGVPDDQMAQVYQCSDAFLHTCNGGGWELPPMEAAACGLPVVAVDAPAQNEWIRTLPGNNLIPGKSQWDSSCSGYRVYATVDDVIEKLLDVLQNKEDWVRKGQLNAQHCIDNYSWSGIVPQWENIFRKLTNPKTKVPGWRVLQEV